MPTSYPVDRAAELLPFLFERCQDVKKTKIRQWLKHGAIEVNGQTITRHDHPLTAGDIVRINTSGQSRAESTLPRGLEIVFEDDSLIVIDKPANLLTIATDGQREKTAHAHLMKYINGGFARGSKRVWIVHRLDRETSGLIVFAKTETAKQELQTHWDEAEKRYLAIVDGQMPQEEGELRSYLDESRAYKVHSAPKSSRTRLAITQYKVIKKAKTRCLVELKLETGRRNQIRVQLADAGCPVLGDDKYGTASDSIRRLALHANFLSFPHPVTGILQTFESPLPGVLAGQV